MKKTLLTLACLFAAIVAQGNGVLESSPVWTLPVEAYGQFRLVPSRVVTHVTEVVAWDGPWEKFPGFGLEIGSANAHRVQPGNFELVELSVGLKGWRAATQERNAVTVQMFDRPSKPGDIKIAFHPLPANVELEKEYKAATIEGDGALCSWEVYVRFSGTKPDYVRSRETKGESEPGKMQPTAGVETL
jgi:hypothetical protein